MSRSSADTLSGRAAVVGIGATDFSTDSGRSELHLAVEAIGRALADAGLSAADVDGLTTFSADTNPESYIADAMGMGDLTFFSRIHYGGGAACGTVQQAAMAVATGVADVVVCYRALNERSGLRFGSPSVSNAASGTTENTRFSWLAPFGLRTPASWIAMFAQRYLDTYAATTEAFGHVAIACRAHASTNPLARFYERPLSMDEHQASRWISEPLRLFDCCLETDGAQAIVVTSIDRARALPKPPAVISAAAQGSGRHQHPMVSYYRDDMTSLPELGVVATQLWRTSHLSPADIDVAILYDHFTPFVLMQLEELGFCERGDAKHFVEDGNIQIGGTLPVNTHGGQLGEAYLHGMNGIAEAVRQIRGEAVNQVPDAEHVLATSATGPPTSGLILSRDA
jgi:acetyl-CoA acetyltransferase